MYIKGIDIVDVHVNLILGVFNPFIKKRKTG